MHRQFKSVFMHRQFKSVCMLRQFKSVCMLRPDMALGSDSEPSMPCAVLNCCKTVTSDNQRGSHAQCCSTCAATNEVARSNVHLYL